MIIIIGAMDNSVSSLPKSHSKDVNNAFKEMMEEFGINSEDESDDLIPSCCLCLFLDYLFLNMCNFYKTVRLNHCVPK